MEEPLDPNAICPASGLTNARCMASICDCFPNEPDRFALHPEYFHVAGTPPNPRGICPVCAYSVLLRQADGRLVGHHAPTVAGEPSRWCGGSGRLPERVD